MNKPVLVITYVLFVLFKNAFAQDPVKIAEDRDSKKDMRAYAIKAFNGGDRKVHIMPDYFNHLLKISCFKDTITILDYWSVPAEVSVLNKNFIKISYAVRGGSGVGLGNVMVLCVNGGKLYEAMHVLEYLTGESGDEQDLYKIKLTISGDNKRTYKLHVGIHDSVKSKATPAINYNYNNQTVLSFDETRNVFYCIKEDIYDKFILYPKMGKNENGKLGGNYPVIILSNNTYYYVRGEWWSLGSNKELNGFTTHTTR